MDRDEHGKRERERQEDEEEWEHQCTLICIAMAQRDSWCAASQCDSVYFCCVSSWGEPFAQPFDTWASHPVTGTCSRFLHGRRSQRRAVACGLWRVPLKRDKETVRNLLLLLLLVSILLLLSSHFLCVIKSISPSSIVMWSSVQCNSICLLIKCARRQKEKRGRK